MDDRFKIWMLKQKNDSDSKISEAYQKISILEQISRGENLNYSILVSSN